MTAGPHTGPFLVTERLELWLPRACDLHPMYAIITHPETGRYLGANQSFADHFMRFARNAGSWYLYGYGSLMVRERGSGSEGELIGNCGVFHSARDLGPAFDDRPEAGWILKTGHTGKGYAAEAMQAILKWFDDEFAEEMVCMIEPGNAPSLRLAGMLGFQPMREAHLPDGAAVRLLERGRV